MLELFGMFVLALTPILWLVFALMVLKWQAYTSALGALVVACIAATFAWHMSTLNLATAALEGVLMALWPIVIVIIAAVFTYNLTVHTGAMETIKAMLCSVSADKRVLTLLIAWSFGNFLEGMAGFGTAVAIPASMLLALGVEPVVALLACLIANGVPTMFGSIGIPTTTLSTITGIDPITLGVTQSLQVLPFVVLCPILIVMLVGGGPRALKGALAPALIGGLGFGLPMLATAAFIGADLPDIVGSVVSLIATFVYSLKSTAEVPTEYRIATADKSSSAAPSAREAAVAWAPFILIFVVLLATSKIVPLVNKPLSSVMSVVNVYAGNPEAVLKFYWINTPGVLILLSGIVGGLIQGATVPDMLRVLGATCKQMSKTIVTMLGVLAVAKIMGYSGMISSVAAFFVAALGGLYPLVAPVLGALGTFVTGSGTSSEVLFGTVQQHAAQSIGAPESWLAASNSLGVSAGKMLSPQNIAIGCAACGLTGKEGNIMAKMAPYAFGYLLLMMVEVYLGALLGISL